MSCYKQPYTQCGLSYSTIRGAGEAYYGEQSKRKSCGFYLLDVERTPSYLNAPLHDEVHKARRCLGCCKKQRAEHTRQFGRCHALQSTEIITIYSVLTINNDLWPDYDGRQTAKVSLSALCAKKDMWPAVDVSAAPCLQCPRQHCDGWLLCD